MKFELKQHFQIDSARFLPHLPKSHPCAHTHGHTFKITISLKGPKVEPIGWVIDYNDIIKKVQPILSLVDHKILNEIQGLENPTTENLCVWLFERIKKAMPELTAITISETPNSECRYEG
jgi:6-pyruvoyltetrahydropterin/6-carboxytetrahydropterin synthase